MKTLFLLRHGKSDWNTGGADHERTLAPRGIAAAERVGQVLAALDEVPQRIVSSTAVRARETARLAVEAAPGLPEVQLEPEFYGTTADGVVAWLQRQDDSVERLLLVGHQPTWSLLAGGLIGGGSVRFPTATLVRIDLTIASWSGVQFGCGELVWHLPARVVKKL